MSFTLKTDNAPRALIAGYELTDKERAEFDYYSPEELDDVLFFRYKGSVFDIDEFLLAPESLKPWHAYFSLSYFTGIIIKCDDRRETVIVGAYYC